MVNREYIKSQIDTLPEEIVIGIDKYIARQSKKKSEKAKNNAEYLAMLDKAQKEIADGEYVTLTKKQLEMLADE